MNPASALPRARLSALPPAVAKTQLQSLPLLSRGKVRDLYAVGSKRLLMVEIGRAHV